MSKKSSEKKTKRLLLTIPNGDNTAEIYEVDDLKKYRGKMREALDNGYIPSISQIKEEPSKKKQ